MITKQKGTYDLAGKQGKIYSYIEDTIKGLMDSYNYEYIKTPIIESSNLFHRGVGETTDIVTKETYDFKDRGDREVTLRPEGTAGVVRSFIENKEYVNAMPKKYWYLGTMYRYERPQSGRYREFMQFGCEALGSSSPALDAEIISIPVYLFESLGLTGIKVRLNTLGNKTSRENYKKALLEHFKPHIDELCDDCKARFEKNPLRILDCKVDCDNKYIKNAPRTIDYLDEESKKHFDDVMKYLNALDIDFELDERIIRGLDYYTHTVFEIEANVEEFGAQKVMCGGGRYDNLVKTLDGPEVPAVGFAIGIERLMKALEYEKLEPNTENYLDSYIIAIGENAKEFAFSLNGSLRLVGLKSDMDYDDKKLKNAFKQAEEYGTNFALIIGDDELNGKYINVRNMKTKEETKVNNSEIIDFLINNIDTSRNNECSCDNCNGECLCDNCSDECNCEDDCNCDDDCTCDGNCSCGDNCTCDHEHKCNDEGCKNNH